ncbi:hypothetical protein D9M73_117370 [compost metagenome]
MRTVGEEAAIEATALTQIALPSRDARQLRKRTRRNDVFGFVLRISGCFEFMLRSLAGRR